MKSSSMGDLKFQQKFPSFTDALTYAKIRPRKAKNIGASIKSYERRNAMGRKKKIVNNSVYPQHLIERFARCVIEDIRADFAKAEVQAEFARWMEEHENGAAEEGCSF